jgi:carboxymethylenebutenolidase
MAERDVTITTPDGECGATLHTPSGSGPWPAVILFTDAYGVRPTMHDMAQRLADLGYAVLLPDLYYRAGAYEPFDPASAFSDPGERSRLMGLVSTVTKDAATRDTGAFLEFLATQPEVADTKVGTTGYCMGGGLALNAAGRFPDRVGAAASFHGGRIATDDPDSPHLLAGSMEATVYVAGAQHDASFDDAAFATMAAALADGDVDHELVTYPAAHGFAVPDNPTFDEAAAERHWQALRDLYGSALT